MNRILMSILTVISYVNVGFLVLLTTVTVIDVIARYIFNTSFFDAMTISQYLLAMMNALALALLTYRKDHIKVEILYDRLHPGLKAVCDMTTTLLASVLFFIMAWNSFAGAVHSYRTGFHIGWMQLPEYPAKYVFGFGCFLTAIFFSIQFIGIFFGKKEAMHLHGQNLSTNHTTARNK